MLWFDARSVHVDVGGEASDESSRSVAIYHRLLKLESLIYDRGGSSDASSSSSLAVGDGGGDCDSLDFFPLDGLRVGVMYDDVSLADAAAPRASEASVAAMDDARFRITKYVRSKLGDRTTLRFVRVPTTYYDHDLAWRARITKAPSEMHIAKTIVMENTRAPPEVKDCSNPKLSKYYAVMVQYARRLNTDRVRKYLAGMNTGVLGSKFFNPRLCPEELSEQLTGFEKGAVVPLAMNTDIPAVVAKHIAEDLSTVILGGGHVDLKLHLPVSHLLELLRTRGDDDALPPFIVDCTE